MLYHRRVAGSSSELLSSPLSFSAPSQIPPLSRLVRGLVIIEAKILFYLFEDSPKSPNTLLSETGQETSDRASDLVKAYEGLSPRAIHLRESCWFLPLLSYSAMNPLEETLSLPFPYRVCGEYCHVSKSEVEQLMRTYVTYITACSKRLTGTGYAKALYAVRSASWEREREKKGRERKSFYSKAHANG